MAGWSSAPGQPGQLWAAPSDSSWWEGDGETETAGRGAADGWADGWAEGSGSRGGAGRV